MRNLILLAVVAAAIVWLGRNYAPRPESVVRPGESVSRGPVDQIRRQPDALMDMGNAMPAAGGASSKAMLDTARGAAQ